MTRASPDRDAPAAVESPPLLGLGGACALALGVLLAMGLPRLPSWWLIGIVSSVALILLARQPNGRDARVAGPQLYPALWRWAGALLLGMALSCVHGALAMAARLPPALAGVDLRLEGRVEGMADVRDGHTRWDFLVEGVVAAPDPDSRRQAQALIGRRVRLGWYRGDAAAVPPLPPGSRWQLQVRLARPRGVLNPGGADLERYALQRRIAATGYVREPGSARALSAASGGDAWRAGQAERIAVAVGQPSARFVQALALGDTRGLDDRDWEILRSTGLTHLIAISGFHVGMVAGFGALLAAMGYRALPRLGRWLPRVQGSAVVALAFAGGYAAVAGFALPTVRTVLMIAVVLMARLLRRAQSGVQAFALALVAVLLVDPLALLAPGFWLSFLGVAWLMWCLPRDPGRGRLREFLSAQAVATLALLPLTVWFFGQASPVGPLANLIGIPWISLCVVPMALAGLAVDPAWPAAGAWLFRTSAQAMDVLWGLLERMAAWPGALVWLPEASLGALLLGLTGAFWLLLPRGVPGKPLALALLLPLLWPAGPNLEEGEFELTLIDVGQGLALLVRTADRALLYDTGPSYPGGLDLGEAAVLPALRALGVTKVDTLVISHGDSDHSGGLRAVLAAMPPRRILAPAGWARAGMQACNGHPGWRWNGVRFRFLHPPPHFPYLRNESSCVLRVESPYGAALLAGDIGEVVETRLRRERPDSLRADLLVVPHHGSAGSSSPAFLRAVAPRFALLSSGYRNRFGLPASRVVDRYVGAGILVADSAELGAVQARVDADGARLTLRMRLDRRRFWHEPARRPTLPTAIAPD